MTTARQLQARRISAAATAAALTAGATAWILHPPTYLYVLIPALTLALLHAAALINTANAEAARHDPAAHHRERPWLPTPHEARRERAWVARLVRDCTLALIAIITLMGVTESCRG